MQFRKEKIDNVSIIRSSLPGTFEDKIKRIGKKDNIIIDRF